MGSKRHLPALYQHANGSMLREQDMKGLDSKDISLVKEKRDVAINVGQCRVQKITADQLSSMSISDARLRFERGTPLLFNISDILPASVAEALYEEMSLDKILLSTGEVEVKAGEIPYATKFNADTETMTLSEYIQRHVRGASAVVKDMLEDKASVKEKDRVINAIEAAEYLMNTTQGIPLYLFGQSLNEKLSILQRSISSLSSEGDYDGNNDLSLRQLLEEGSNYVETQDLGEDVTISHLLQAASPGIVPHTGRRLHMSYIFQFFLGGPLSGAPFHDHGGAFNFLVYGRKMWHLLPPSRDVYSSMHPLKFARAGGVENPWFPYRNVDDAIAGRIPESLAGPCSFTQGPGEVLWVPPRWSHSTLALSENVGFAVEIVEAGVSMRKSRVKSL